MANDEIRTAIQGFFQDLEKSELIKFHNSRFFPLFRRIQQNAEIDHLAQTALLRLHDVCEQLTPDQQSKFITDDQYHALEISSCIAQLRANTEEFTSFLKISTTQPVTIDGEIGNDFNDVLEGRALEKITEFNDTLNSDGSNLIQFLFSLKNFPKQNARTKFSKIKNEFQNMFQTSNLDLMCYYNIDMNQDMIDGEDLILQNQKCQLLWLLIIT